jgi:DUF4097 and DUF4098 domain-containing protein YvlB
MNPRFPLLLLIFLGSAITALATSEEIIQRHFDAGPGGKLVVDVDFGTVEVKGDTDGKTVGISARRTVEMSDKALEKEFVAAAPITISQENNIVTVRARSNRQWKWNGNHTRMDAVYVVTVPNNFNADLHTGGGEIKASDLTGQIQANSAGGRLDFARIHGPVDGKTAGGTVKLTECDGDMKIQSRGGQIQSLGGKGSLDAHTAGGQISVRDFAGGVAVGTKGGQLNFDNVHGPLTATTGGGAINARLADAADVKLETGAGAINVAVPANAGFDVDAASPVGGITTELMLNGKHQGDGRLIGTLNGGGKPLFLRTSAGSISIRSAGTEKASR